VQPVPSFFKQYLLFCIDQLNQPAGCAFLSTVGSRAFPAGAPQIWNSLSEHIVSAPMLQSFRRHLKTFLL